jgi:outer membrane protein assembly factor BamA
LTGDSRLGDIGLSIVRDSRDDPFLPTKGSQVIGEARMFAEPLFSDSNFLKLSLRGSKVWTYPSQVQFATDPSFATIVKTSGNKFIKKKFWHASGKTWKKIKKLVSPGEAVYWRILAQDVDDAETTSAPFVFFVP